MAKVSGIPKSGANPQSSVIMTAFNTESYVREALNSLIRQEEKDFEIVFVDDGSTVLCKPCLRRHQ